MPLAVMTPLFCWMLPVAERITAPAGALLLMLPVRNSDPPRFSMSMLPPAPALPRLPTVRPDALLAAS